MRELYLTYAETRAWYGLYEYTDLILGTDGQFGACSGNDVVWGPVDGLSMSGFTYGGDDQLIVNSGTNNNISTDQGSDTIWLKNGYGFIYAGEDNDNIQVEGGFWWVGGDSGDDTIVNWAYVSGDIFGGFGNDYLINAGGASAHFYGGPGFDVFAPGAIYNGQYVDSFMVIKDFEWGIDAIDTTHSGPINYVPRSEGGYWMETAAAGTLLGYVEYA